MEFIHHFDPDLHDEFLKILSCCNTSSSFECFGKSSAMTVAKYPAPMLLSFDWMWVWAISVLAISLCWAVKYLHYLHLKVPHPFAFLL
jgi:hypothetical protein